MITLKLGEFEFLPKNSTDTKAAMLTQARADIASGAYALDSSVTGTLSDGSPRYVVRAFWNSNDGEADSITRVNDGTVEGVVVLATMRGDLNGDGKVNTLDYNSLDYAYENQPGDPNCHLAGADTLTAADYVILDQSFAKENKA